MTATVEELRTRYPQTRGMDDETVRTRASDFHAALRARYCITREDAYAAFTLTQAVRAHFGWWLLYVDQVGAESMSATGASTTYGAPDWPDGLADMLASISDAQAAPVTQLTR